MTGKESGILFDDGSRTLIIVWKNASNNLVNTFPFGRRSAVSSQSHVTTLGIARCERHDPTGRRHSKCRKSRHGASVEPGFYWMPKSTLYQYYGTSVLLPATLSPLPTQARVPVRILLVATDPGDTLTATIHCQYQLTVQWSCTLLLSHSHPNRDVSVKNLLYLHYCMVQYGTPAGWYCPNLGKTVKKKQNSKWYILRSES